MKTLYRLLLIQVDNINLAINLVYNWIYGMLMQSQCMTLYKKIALWCQKWATLACNYLEQMIEQRNPTTDFDITSSKLGLPIMTPVPLNQYYDISYDNKTLSVHFIYYSISKTNFYKISINKFLRYVKCHAILFKIKGLQWWEIGNSLIAFWILNNQ